MLYAYKEIEQVTSLRLIITRIINEIEMNENIVFQNHIFKIIKDAAQLKSQEKNIYSINSRYIREIIFLSENANDNLLNSSGNLDINQLKELLSLLERFK